MARPSSDPSQLPPPQLVEEPGAFARMLEDLDGQEIIAVDTEADSFFSYQEKVCLIQITVEDRDYVVDPLAGFDVAPLGTMLADPNRRKVFHDGEYDVLIMKRDYGFEFGGLFDTRVAAAALGEANPGLASVLRKHFDVELDKSLQRSDWSRRPLDDGQIAYARLDTRYLIPLTEILEAELEDRGRTAVVEGECRRLEALEPTSKEFNPDDFARIKGVRDLSGIGKRCLRELFVLRERVAEERDRPPFKVMSNQLMLAIAKSMPRSIKTLSNTPGFSSRMIRKLGEDVLDAVAHAESEGPIDRLPQTRSKDGSSSLDDLSFELHERLRLWRKERAEHDGMDASLVLNRHVMLELAKARPRDLDAIAAIDGVARWQLDSFGDELEELFEDFENDAAAGRITPTRGRKRQGDSRRPR